MKFSDNLRNARLSRNLTQMKLAEGIGTSQSAVAAWETGAREPDFKTIERIAVFFGIPMSSLLPSNDNVDKADIVSVAEAFQNNPKLRVLFEKTRFMQEQDLDAVIAVVNAIVREKESRL